MIYSFMQPSDAAAVSSLVWEVFEEFEAPDYCQEGIEEFKRFIQPEYLATRISERNFYIICCRDGNKLAGVIAVRDRSHIALLFVRKEYQQRGIGRTLLSRAMSRCLEDAPGLQEITVNSSPYAVEIYEKLGFVLSGPEQTLNGIRFTPMRLIMGARVRTMASRAGRIFADPASESQSEPGLRRRA